MSGGTLIEVDSAAALEAALSHAEGGDTILLAAGNYGHITIDQAFAETVTLRAAAPGTVTFNGMRVEDAKNVTLDGMVFDYTHHPDHSLGQRAFRIIDSTGITIQNAVFDGDDNDAAGGTPTGKGLSISGSSGIVLEDSLVEGFWKGVLFTDSTDVTLARNELRDLRSDGVNLVDTSGVLIEGNHMHDFRTDPKSGDHPDMIQMYPSGHRELAQDITIRDNILDIGEGGISHGIFLTQPTQIQDDLTPDEAYRDISVTGNVIIGGHIHGITVDRTDGLEIAQNTLLPPLGSGLPAPRINLDGESKNVTVTDNIVSRITGTLQEDWTVSGNLELPESPAGYDAFFINARSDATNALENLQLMPGGPADLAGVGAPMLAYNGHPDTPTALGRGETGDLVNIFHFDGRYSAGPGGDAVAAGASFHWDFGDGTSATGPVVSHRYTTAGSHQAVLTVTWPDGTQDSSMVLAEINDPNVVSFDDGALWRHDTGHNHPLKLHLDGATLDPDSGAILFADGDRATVGRDHLGRLSHAESFAVEASLRIDEPGEVMRIHQSFTLGVTSTGELHFMVLPADGSKIVTMTKGAGLRDGGWHDIAVRYNGTALELEVDGVTLASVPGGGALKPITSWGVLLGKSFEGALDSFAIKVDPERYDLDPAAPEPSNGPLEDLLLSDHFDLAFEADFARVDDRALKGGADIVIEEGQAALALAPQSWLDLGRQKALEDADQIILQLDFARDVADGSHGRLVWNHTRLGVILEDDHLEFRVGTADGKSARFDTEDLGLNTTDAQSLLIALDDEKDIFQVWLNGERVLSESDHDFDWGSSAEYQWGWNLGSSRHANTSVTISDFQLSDGGAPSTPQGEDIWDLLIG